MEAGCISGHVSWSVHHPYPSFWFLPQCLTPNVPYSQMSPFSSPGLNPSLCSSPLLSTSMLELPVSVMIWDLIFFILIGVKKAEQEGEDASISERCLMQDAVSPGHTVCAREILCPEIQEVPEALWEGWEADGLACEFLFGWCADGWRTSALKVNEKRCCRAGKTHSY